MAHIKMLIQVVELEATDERPDADAEEGKYQKAFMLPPMEDGDAVKYYDLIVDEVDAAFKLALGDFVVTQNEKGILCLVGMDDQVVEFLAQGDDVDKPPGPSEVA